METKFTKGKWETNNDYVWSGIVQICDIYEIDKENKDIEAIANAKLISAAPEMLNALNICVESLQLNLSKANFKDEESMLNAYNLAKETINKAIGSYFF